VKSPIGDRESRAGLAPARGREEANQARDCDADRQIHQKNPVQLSALVSRPSEDTPTLPRRHHEPKDAHRLGRSPAR